MPIRIAINGFGRIGRPVFRIILDNHLDLEVVAINDLTNTKTLVHLLKYDSLYGVFPKTVQFTEGSLEVDGTKTKVLAEKDPENLPWQDLGVDVVLECTGYFTDFEKAAKHLKAGAKKVIISSPSKDPDKIRSFILGINEEEIDSERDNIIDMGSCTTNCLAPIAKVLDREFKIARGFMTTVHSYTNDQRILDLPHDDLRRARAAALNIIPTSTGAAKAIGRVLPALQGKLDGIALRVPTPTVSVLDLVCQTEEKTTTDKVNEVLREASKEKNYQGILRVEDDLLVSSDYKGNSFSSIVDSSLTMAKDNLIKVVAWYDNEWGYSCRLAEMASCIGKKI